MQNKNLKVLESNCHLPSVLDFIKSQEQIDFCLCHLKGLHLNRLRQGKVEVILSFQAFSVVSRSYLSIEHTGQFMLNLKQGSHSNFYKFSSNLK